MSLSMALGAGAVLLQSNVLSGLSLSGVRPDLVLILIVYFANMNGSIPGQLTGFVSGLVRDLITLSPLGFHSLVYATLGLVYGGTKDKIFMDPILVPMLMVLGGTMAKGLLASLLAVVFGIENVAPSIWSTAFLIEAGMNALLTPVFFAVFRIVHPLKIRAPGSTA